MPHLEAGFYQQTLFEQNFVCQVAERHPRVRSKPSKQAFLAEGHIVVTTSGTGHAIVDKVLAKKGYRRRGFGSIMRAGQDHRHGATMSLYQAIFLIGYRLHESSPRAMSAPF